MRFRHVGNVGTACLDGARFSRVDIDTDRREPALSQFDGQRKADISSSTTPVRAVRDRIFCSKVSAFVMDNVLFERWRCRPDRPLICIFSWLATLANHGEDGLREGRRVMTDFFTGAIGHEIALDDSSTAGEL